MVSTILDVVSNTPLLQGIEPDAFALRVVETHADDPQWLDAFTAALNRRRSAGQAERVLAVWGLNSSEVARMFGVSRQAVSRWIIDGVPAAHVVTFADLAAATDLLVHYVQADRIAAVVRRPATALDGRSLLDLVADQRSADVLDACRRMFQFTDVHR